MILVTGATGQIGSLVVKHLLNSGTAVRAFVREENSSETLNNPLLDITIGDFEDIESIKKAVEGVERLFLLTHDNPNQVEQHENVIRVSEESNVKHIIKLSAFGASPDSPIALMRWHAKTEEQLRDSKISWTFIRPHLYMQNLLRFGDQVKNENMFTAPMGSDKFSLVDIRDVAEVAAKILAGNGHADKIYTLTGPNANSYEEIATQLSSILRKTVNYDKVSQGKFYDQLVAQGTPTWRAYDLANISNAYVNGDKKLVTKDINQLLGRPARDIETFLEDYKQVFLK